MMGKGHFFNLTSYGIMEFTYSGLALIDFSNCELTLNEVPIHFYTECFISFTRLLCWLGPIVFFPHIPMELSSYLRTCSTKFYVQKDTRLIRKKHIATIPLQATFGHIQNHVQDIHNLKILNSHWFIQRIM